MKRQRGFLLSLGLSALLSLTASQAQAGSITLTVDLGGTVIFTATSVAPDMNLSVPALLTSAVNTDLAAAGSIYRFSSLGANSNFSGSATGFLQTNGQINIVAGTNTASLSVDTTQSGFLSPIGPGGTIVSSLGGDYVGVASGTTTYTSDYNGPPLTTTPALTGTATGGSTSFSSLTPSASIDTIPSGYSLSNHFVISLAPGSINGSEGFTGSVMVSAIPEPASLVMLLTGMPLPLAIVFGLIRRRRAEA